MKISKNLMKYICGSNLGILHSIDIYTERAKRSQIIQQVLGMTYLPKKQCSQETVPKPMRSMSETLTSWQYWKCDKSERHINS